MWFCPVCGDLRKLRACCTQVVRMLRASCKFVVFEQNMSQSGEIAGRLVDRKHTLRPRNDMWVCEGLYSGEAGAQSPGAQSKLPRNVKTQRNVNRHVKTPLVVFEQNMSESGEIAGRLVDRKHTLRPRNDNVGL